MNDKIIDNVELFQYWLFVAHKMTFGEFKEAVLNAGYTIYSIKSE